MNPKIYLSLALAGAMTLAGCVSMQQAQNKGPMGLKDAYARKFLIGTAGDLPGRYSDAELANIKLNYNIVTPENNMKPQPTHPSENVYEFRAPDALVEWCESNHIKVWGHNLAWHTQTAPWFFLGPNGGTVTRELAMERLSNHIHAVAGHFKGHLFGWDVVNEAINDGYNGEPDNLRNDSWYSIIGSNYLTMAFKWAHEADPSAQLYYNDYNIEQGAVKHRGKHAASMSLLKRMIKDGAPINGVGIQGHWHLDTDLADVEKAIKDYESLGLKISISELDVTATGGNSGAFTVGGGGALTERQTTLLRDAIDAAHAKLAPLQDKLNAAQKEVVSAVLAKSDDATVRSKLEAVANIQTEISMFRFTKGVREIATTVTANQKTNITTAAAQTYYSLFGGPPPAAGGRGGGGGGGGFGGFGGGRGGRGGAPIAAEALQKQAQVYAKLFDIFNRHAKSISRVTFWGISDTRSWRGGQAALVYDGQLNPKPAYQAILDVAAGKKTTQ